MYLALLSPELLDAITLQFCGSIRHWSNNLQTSLKTKIVSM